MKKKRMIVRVLALILAFLMVLGAITSAVLIATAEEEIFVSVSGEDTTALVTQKITYTNNTGSRLDNILFQVYGNVFRREASIPFDADAFPAGYAPAGILFYRITVNGEDCDWGMQGTDETFLRVAAELAPGESCEVAFDYYVITTENAAFLGAGAEDWRFFHFCPVPCVYRYGEFQAVPVNAVCDFGMTECDDFKVTISVPENYRIAAPGTAAENDGSVTYTLNGARDFAFLISKKWRVKQGVSALGTGITVYAENRTGAPRALSYAKKALDFFEALFGPLPCGSLTIAESQISGTALSSTGIAAVSTELFSKTEELEREIAFLTAKQYFGISAAVDPAREIWLTDALCRYLEYLYVRDTYGDRKFSETLNSELRPSLQMTIPGGLTPDAYTNVFQSEYNYDLVVMDRGSAALNELRKLVGFDTFFEALKLYYGSSAGGFGTLETFVNAFNEAAGRELGYFIVDTLMNIGDYADSVLEYYD